LIRGRTEPPRRAVAYDPDGHSLRVGALPDPALLESLAGSDADARWSVLAARPRLVFEATGNRWSIRSRGALPPGLGRGGDNPLGGLAALLAAFGLDRGAEPPGPDEPGFRGGLIGYLGYDLAPRLERLPRRLPAAGRMPDVRLGLYDTYLLIDHRERAAQACAVDLTDAGPAAMRRRLDRLVAALEAPAPPIGATRPAAGPASDFSRDEYLAAVARAIDYIAAGDAFQVNLSQRFAGRFEAIDPRGLYRALRRVSPAPFAAFLGWDDLAVASASPEWFYRTRGDAIVTRPIKGTRPRGGTPELDAAQVATLRASPKDRAELTMIIDLERNDLGRVCEYGSVHVVEPYAVETFAQVHHLVATVEGRLRPGAGPVDVLAAMFPGGSITGAPKIRAMEIIDELERARRGVYTGAIGYFSRGASAFNIAIRTLMVEGRTLSYHVGGGIVADSDPVAEFEETLHKGGGLRLAIEAAGAGG
jgi:para-aminobenzoate synthetase component 1